MHTVRCTAAHVADVLEANSLLHGQGTQGFGDAGYQGIDKRLEAKPDVTWHVAMRPCKRRALDLNDGLQALRTDKIEKAKASIRAKVEHPSRVVKRQFGYIKTRYKGLMKNTQQLQYRAVLRCKLQPVYSQG